MANSIIVFGPPDSGKSTLVGYIFAKSDPAFDLKNFIKSIDHHIWYRNNQKFAYILDSSSNERCGVRHDDSSFVGTATSQVVHSKRIVINKKEILFWDTPGHPKYFEGQTGKQLLGGQLGLFLLTPSQINKLHQKITSSSILNNINSAFLQLFDIILPLKLWLNLKNQKQTIILISKIDSIAYDKNIFCETIDKLNEIASFFEIDISNIDILPISIDVTNENDYNIFVHSSQNDDILGYNKSFTLVESIVDYFNNSLKFYDDLNCTNLVMNITKGHVAKFIPSEIFRGNILRGKVKEKNAVKIAPCKIDNTTGTVVGNISSVKHEDGCFVSGVDEGEFVGIGLNKVSQFKTGRRIKEFKIYKKTTLIISDSLYFQYGNILKMQLLDDCTLNKNNLLKIYWFGNHLNCIILDKINDLFFLKILGGNVAAIPIDNNQNKIFKNFTIYKKDVGMFKCEFLDLGFIDCCTLEISIAKEHLNKIFDIITNENLYSYNINYYIDKICIDFRFNTVGFASTEFFLKSINMIKKLLKGNYIYDTNYRIHSLSDDEI